MRSMCWSVNYKSSGAAVCLVDMGNFVDLLRITESHFSPRRFHRILGEILVAVIQGIKIVIKPLWEFFLEKKIFFEKKFLEKKFFLKKIFFERKIFILKKTFFEKKFLEKKIFFEKKISWKKNFFFKKIYEKWERDMSGTLHT